MQGLETIIRNNMEAERKYLELKSKKEAGLDYDKQLFELLTRVVNIKEK